MKTGSDKIEMNINIGGELIKLKVDFDEQNAVRDAEREVKNFIELLKKNWPQKSDRNILAMAAYQYAKGYMMLMKSRLSAIEMAEAKTREISKVFSVSENDSE